MSDDPRQPESPGPMELWAWFDHAWARLVDGWQRGRSAWHLPGLATMTPDGPTVRTVVLRHADPAARLLVCHTDARSDKVAEIRDDPRVAWLFYDQANKLQARLHAVARVETDTPRADRQWLASNNSARRCYLAPHPPGTPVDSPDPNLPEDVRDRVPETVETGPGRDRFAVVLAQIHAIDLLSLAHDGHHRAKYQWVDDRWQGTWVTV